MDIDRDILPLVTSLQRAGFKTLASCHGHAIGRHTPYVYFQCSIEAAQDLDMTISQCSGLHRRWEVTGHFGEAGLTWLLRSPDWESALQGSRAGILSPLLTQNGRQELADDLYQLAQLVAGDISVTSSPPITTMQHFWAVAIDALRAMRWHFRFGLGCLVGIGLSLVYGVIAGGIGG